jgi:hypothetical protein
MTVKIQCFVTRGAGVAIPVSQNSNDEISARHYTCAEIANLWNVSTDTVRRLFRDEEGVLMIPSRNSHRPLRANYNTMLIPESVVKRVHAKYSFGKH